jgi:beta-carotene 3-hydroxylase
MEMWARFAHKKLWHDYEPGWALHKSHHEPRTGPFEANDIFAGGALLWLRCLKATCC